ncbi:MAG: S9 family peptidase [Bacteroidia bacterium]
MNHIQFSPLLMMLAIGCTQTTKMEEPQAPVAQKIPTELNMHGHTRVDNYYWLNERENPEVIDYLNAENDYKEKVLAHTKKLQDELFNEMKGRIKEDDSNVPYFSNGYWYYVRFETEKNYPIYCRKAESMEAAEEIMFDVNQYAEGYEYFSLVGVRVSPDNQIAMFFTDTVGRRQYSLSFKNLITGEQLPVSIYPTNGAAAWASDNKTVFYGTNDAQTLRSDKIWKYRLGEEPAAAKLAFEEKDETFNTYVFLSKSRKYIYISSGSTLTSEQQFINANEPNTDFKLIQPRTRGIEYDAEDYGNDFYIRTNKDARNFCLMKTPIARPQMSNWQVVIPHREEVLLEDTEYFSDYMVLQERSEGLTRLRVRDWKGQTDYFIPMNDPAWYVYPEINREYNTSILRYGYTSLTTPNTIFSFDMKTREQKILKQQEVLGDFKAENYVSERFFVSARDGAQIPVSLVYRKSAKNENGNPTLLYGYGSYGSSMDAYFSSNRLSLLDRGFVFAIAHIRGGEEMGREWYENGKLLNKKNTFYDFIDCGEFLLANNYTTPGQLYAMGGSAGGLLMGAVINMRPDLWHGVVAQVPFVDVITTMLDESIPLTTGEYDEWGNPNDKTYYDYMLSYSPYDQVSKQAYPNILVTTGLHDSQVQYWEPAKWVAKMREYQQGSGKILLKTDMNAGHGGKSGRFNALHDTALEYAFLLDLAKAN